MYNTASSDPELSELSELLDELNDELLDELLNDELLDELNDELLDELNDELLDELNDDSDSPGELSELLDELLPGTGATCLNCSQ